MHDDGQTIRDAAERHLGVDADSFLRWLKPAVFLDEGIDSLSASHLGGSPELDADQSWPECNGRPLSFLAAVDLADVAETDSGLNLPRSGVLNFFYDVDRQPWGFDPADRGSWAVVHCLAGVPTTPPPTSRVFKRVPLATDRVITFPHWHEDDLEPLRSSRFDDFFELVDELAPDGWPRQANHQVGGWPLLEQGPLWLSAQLTSHGVHTGGSDWTANPRYEELARGASEWQLLIQIDSDERTDWMWGDVGKLYFLIRTDDLAARRFDRVWLELQCG